MAKKTPPTPPQPAPAGPDADLLGAAMEADAASAGEFLHADQGNQPPPEVERDPVAECADQLAIMLERIGQTAAMRFPSLRPLYAADTCKETAASMAPALVKLGWWNTDAESMVYLSALLAGGSLAFATFMAIRMDIQAERINEAAQRATGTDQPAPAPEPAPESGVHPQTALYR